MGLLEREPLLADLNARLAETRTGQGRLVMVSGEAGIGKSALVDAFVGGLPRGTQVLHGACDPVTPARPFAPIIDMARQVRDGLGEALANADRDQVIDRFLALLQRQPSGGVLIFEDLHWADSATLDLLKVVGRRLSQRAVLVIGTYRGHDMDSDHPLRLTLGEIPSRLRSELIVPPLTIRAVAALAGTSVSDASALHQATGGNPFFVTEIIAAEGVDLPPTVRDAVAARVGRLSADAQMVLGAAAILGSRGVEPHLLIAMTQGPATPSGIGECLSKGMLQEQAGLLAFRHDLARRAVLEALPPAERVRLHGRALAALRSGVASADSIRLAVHAIEAGDADAIVELAPRAADHAASLGAHGEAADYLAITLALWGRRGEQEHARLLERYAHACSVADRVAAAHAAQSAAVAIWQRLGDRLRAGEALRSLSTYMWQAGEGDRAREVAEAAIDLLEPLEPPGPELAAARAKLAQLLLNSGQDDIKALHWARRALDLANSIGEEPVAVHAQTTLAVAEIYLDIASGWADLELVLRRAKAAGLAEDVVRILINFVEAALDLKRFDVADRYVEEAIAFLAEHDFELYRNLLTSRLAELALERGRWDIAEQEAITLLAGTRRSSQAHVRALGVIGKLRARRGEADAWTALDEAMAIVGPGELQDICPLHAARAEAAWLGGDLARAGDEAMRGLELAHALAPSSFYSDLSFWAWRTGRIQELPDRTTDAYVLHAAGRFRDAARAWREIGCPYHEAEALADSDDEADLRAALELLQTLDARVLQTKVRQRLHHLGAERIPRGPRPSTRSNPAGLSAREMDVLALIRGGARNAEIAEALVLSLKTVDHHVSAVLRKLGVADREAARREAERRGIEHGGSTRPT